MSISDSTRNFIYGGFALLALSGVLLYVALQHWDTLPNYLRLAVFIPLSLAYTMLHVKTYRDWESAAPSDQVRGAMAVVLPVFIVLGAVAWWLFAPEAKS